MARIHNRYGRLAAGVAALSLVAACSGGAGGFKGAGGASTHLAARSADAGDYQTAEALYRQAFEANPNSVEALLGLGRSYAGMGQYARAEQALNEANRRKPKDPAVLLELSRTQLAAGQPQAALASLDVAIKKRPRDVQITTARGIALDRLSRHAEAQATYRQGLERDPTNFALLTNLGLSLGLSGKPDAGIAILRELARDGKATANTRGNLALVYGLAGREKEARATLSADMSGSAIQNNLSYYRQLRGMLAQGKPIGNLGQPLQPVKTASSKAPLRAADPLAAISPVEPAPVSLPTLASLAKAPAGPSPVAALPKATEIGTTPAVTSSPAPVATARAAPAPLPDFVPASGSFSSGIVPETPKAGGGGAGPRPTILPTAPGE